MIKKVTENLSTIVVLFALIGGFFTANNYLAKASDLNVTNKKLMATEKRLDNYIIKDRIDFLQERIWKIEDRYRVGTDNPRPMPISVKEDLREFRREMNLLIEQLKNEDT